MTEAEALEVLSDFSRCVRVKADGAYETNDFLEAKELAITALEKQIPKKPVGLKKNICPNCSWGIIMSNQKYCDECGQKLDR